MPGRLHRNRQRSEYRRLWSIEKPYFDLGDGKKLELHNVPVPHNAEIPWRLRVLREVFGWSALLETIMRRTGEAYEWQMAGVRALPRGAGETLACPLMQRLSRLGIPTLVVVLIPAQAAHDYEMMSPAITE